MDRGIYVAASGGLVGDRQIQVIGNNLANVNTIGFKAERIIRREQEFADSLAGAIGGVPQAAQENFQRTPGVLDIGTVTDFSQGPINSTGNPLDVALTKENQFFVVQTPQGEMFTRAGNFSRDSEGNLVTADGKPVLGEGGPISLGTGEAVHISSNGSVLVGGETVGKLRVVDVSDVTKLERHEGTRFLDKGGAGVQTVDDVTVVPGAVEMPNISVVNAMVELINAHRMFEAYTKSAQTIDTLNDSVIKNARSTL